MIKVYFASYRFTEQQYSPPVYQIHSPFCNEETDTEKKMLSPINISNILWDMGSCVVYSQLMFKWINDGGRNKCAKDGQTDLEKIVQVWELNRLCLRMCDFPLCCCFSLHLMLFNPTVGDLSFYLLNFYKGISSIFLLILCLHYCTNINLRAPPFWSPSPHCLAFHSLSFH